MIGSGDSAKACETETANRKRRAMQLQILFGGRVISILCIPEKISNNKAIIIDHMF
jgi:hypothetical protein